MFGRYDVHHVQLGGFLICVAHDPTRLRIHPCEIAGDVCDIQHVAGVLDEIKELASRFGRDASRLAFWSSRSTRRSGGVLHLMVWLARVGRLGRFAHALQPLSSRGGCSGGNATLSHSGRASKMDYRMCPQASYVKSRPATIAAGLSSVKRFAMISPANSTIFWRAAERTGGRFFRSRA